MLEYFTSTQGGTSTVILVLVTCCLLALKFVFNVKFFILFKDLFRNLVKSTGKSINRKEQRYHRDLEIGKINEKSKRNQLYKFCNNLTIDLMLKRKGITPYEFLFFVLLGSALISCFIGILLFRHPVLALVAYPIVVFGSMCTLYTKANMAHDTRIEAVIAAENIIANNIEAGVLVAVKNNIEVMPDEVRGDFRDFIDNIEQKNFHVRVALLELNNALGSIADDFIKKCISFEMEEERGVVGIFKDVVEINNIKTELRTDMKRQFEAVTTEFILAVTIILVFLVGVILIYPIVRNFYLTTLPGQLLLLVDASIIIIEFVFITYLKAREL